MADELLPAAAVIEKCGGIAKTAKIIDRDRSVVSRWLAPRERGGTCGIVPMRHAHTLLEKVPQLTEADFFVRAPDSEKAA
jgi:hypothetical protein